MPLTASEKAALGDLVELYRSQQDRVELLLKQLISLFVENKALKKHVHSMKWRLKDPDHLFDSLERKVLRAKKKGQAFDITTENFFEKVNDLAGFRILHLYTRQIAEINAIVRSELDFIQMPVVEGPTARTWDDESRAFFEEVGIETKDSGDTLYTSVHYVVRANLKAPYTAEIQIRTLAEELWGEVDHTFNYPHPSPIYACREQIKALARVTSSCTRLVDSIFGTHREVSTAGEKAPAAAETVPAASSPATGSIASGQAPAEAMPEPSQPTAAQPRRAGESIESAGDLHPGDLVEHAHFGLGTVIEASIRDDGSHAAVVRFDTVGQKKLLLSFAKLVRR